MARIWPPAHIHVRARPAPPGARFAPHGGLALRPGLPCPALRVHGPCKLPLSRIQRPSRRKDRAPRRRVIQASPCYNRQPHHTTPDSGYAGGAVACGPYVPDSAARPLRNRQGQRREDLSGPGATALPARPDSAASTPEPCPDPPGENGCQSQAGIFPKPTRAHCPISDFAGKTEPKIFNKTRQKKPEKSPKKTKNRSKKKAENEGGGVAGERTRQSRTLRSTPPRAFDCHYTHTAYAPTCPFSNDDDETTQGIEFVIFKELLKNYDSWKVLLLPGNPALAAPIWQPSDIDRA